MEKRPDGDGIDFDLDGEVEIDRSAPMQEQMSLVVVELRYVRRALAALATASKDRDKMLKTERVENRRALLVLAGTLGAAAIGGAALVIVAMLTGGGG